MVYYKDSAWHIAEEMITYTDDDGTTTKAIGAEGRAWWEDVTARWPNITIQGLAPIEPSPDQEARLDEINALGLGDGWHDEVGTYVMDGAFLDTPIVLKQLQLEKKLAAAEDTLADLIMMQYV